jgi:hypothetical protein
MLASKEFLEEDVIGDPAIYPDDETIGAALHGVAGQRAREAAFSTAPGPRSNPASDMIPEPRRSGAGVFRFGSVGTACHLSEASAGRSFAPWEDPGAKPYISFQNVTKRFGDLHRGRQPVARCL